MEEEILQKIREAVLNYDQKASARYAQEALDSKIEPLTIMDALIEAVRVVGNKFGAGELFLPELVGAADALQASTPLLEEAIRQSGKKRESLGTVVIGTVKDDIHTIGKSMVAALLTAEGFEVYDLGIDVPADKFLEAVEKYDPNIIGMSALLSTTAPQARLVIDELKECGKRDKIKVMVGGGAMTAAFADAIGADGYESSAPGAVTLARNWINS